MMRLGARSRAMVLWVWLGLLSWSLPAAAQSLGDGIKAYDFESLAWGVLVAMVGGTGRTVLTLLSRDVVILSALHEAWRDTVIAALAGAVTYVIVAAYNSFDSMPTLPVPATVLLLAAAGWARMGFFIWSEKAGAKLADGAVSFVTKKMGVGQGGFHRDYSNTNAPPTYERPPAPPTPPNGTPTKPVGKFTRPGDDDER